MSDRYFAKVALVRDEYTVVITRGAVDGVKEGDRFLIVGLGEDIVDPDTNEILEKLEIVRGKTVAVHVQDKVSTLESSEFEKTSDTKEIKKVTTKTSVILGILGPQDTVTESIKPGESYRKELEGVQGGDLAIKL